MAEEPSKYSIFTKRPSPSCILLFILSLFVLGFYTLNHLPFSSSRPSDPLQSLRYRDMFLSSGNNVTIASYLKALTLKPHVAGTEGGYETAKYVKRVFSDLGLDTHITSYDVLLSYPVYASLFMHFGNGVVKELGLIEPGFEGSGVIKPYHAYSLSGSVCAKGVYANYGMEEDYNLLGVLGVNVSGCVVLVRRGDISRGRVVEKAAEKGAVAVLMYTDGGKAKEEGEGVERGTVTMKGVGDPISPGWAGVEGGEKLGLEDLEVSRRFPKIPSLPISARNAYTILGSFEGPQMPFEWRDALRLKVRRIGPGPVTLNFTYQGEMKMVKVHNVFAVIRGQEDPDHYVLLGNHRDAWTFGAVDPNSGTAALLDIARRYALLMHSKWIPRRTIVLCSWDAEEFGMVGSTEWVEQNLLQLGSKAVAYLNVDCAVQGPGVFVGSTPQLDDLFIEVTKKVKDPDSDDMTVFDKWITTGIKIQRLSAGGSDFVPFLQHAGVPSLDLYFGRVVQKTDSIDVWKCNGLMKSIGTVDFPVYHTAYDSYNWMATIGDPFFQRHVAVVGIWGLVALRLADDPILPYSYLSYAEELQGYAHALSNLVKNISLDPLHSSIKGLVDAAKFVRQEAVKLEEQERIGNLLPLKRRTLNDRLILAEKGFLDADGLPESKWFKHLIYGPHSNYGSKLEFFPGIADAISGKATTNDKDKRALIEHEIWRVARAIQRSANALRGELT